MTAIDVELLFSDKVRQLRSLGYKRKGGIKHGGRYLEYAHLTRGWVLLFPTFIWDEQPTYYERFGTDDEGPAFLFKKDGTPLPFRSKVAAGIFALYVSQRMDGYDGDDNILKIVDGRNSAGHPAMVWENRRGSMQTLLDLITGEAEIIYRGAGSFPPQ